MFDLVPIWALFLCLLGLVLVAMEIGHGLLRRKSDRPKAENEALVSVTSASGLGLLAFILAFMFGIVYGRFETRKDLVRQEANAIQTVWLRADFLDTPNRTTAVNLLKQYLDTRLQAVRARTTEDVLRSVRQSETIQRQLWQQGVTRAKQTSIYGMSTIYIQAMNDLIALHSQRLAIGVQDRIPSGIWVAVAGLLLLSMATIGYFSAMKGAIWSPANIILAVSFSLLFVLIAALDNPYGNLFQPSQQPLLNLKELFGQAE
jgi:hypothetical protein